MAGVRPGARLIAGRLCPPGGDDLPDAGAGLGRDPPGAGARRRRGLRRRPRPAEAQAAGAYADGSQTMTQGLWRRLVDDLAGADNLTEEGVAPRIAILAGGIADGGQARMPIHAGAGYDSLSLPHRHFFKVGRDNCNVNVAPLVG